ncbi:hypothetical protein ACF0H5_007427 [Mactra antiquata]
MSNEKRGEALPVTCTDGPFFSRYTEHKVVFNLHAPTPPSPHKPLFADNNNAYLIGRNSDYQANSLHAYNRRYTSNETESPTKKRDNNSDQRSNILEKQIDLFIPVSRHNSSEGSSFQNSPTEFRAISPNFSLYEAPLSTFRSDSLDSNCLSPRSISSADSAKERRFAFSERNAVVNKSRGKLASILNKHSVSILSTAAFNSFKENDRNRQLTVSCPDLIHEGKPLEIPPKSNGSVSALDSITRKDSHEHLRVNNKNLKVPDIFTTSFTHSSPVEEKKKLQKSSISLQDYQSTSKHSEKNNLQRTLSLTKTDPNDLKIGCLLSPTMYRDSQIAQITEYLFIGSIEAAYNERRLCRLEIESLVDISNLADMQVPPHKKLSCPCLCQNELKHFRSRLIIAIPDEEIEGVDQYFEEVNKFIEGARRCSKKVLIYSYEGKSRASLFAVQYLMSFEGLLLRQAYNMVKKQRPEVSLNPAFQSALEKLEKSLFPDEKHSVNICNEYLNVADPQAIKCAWIDC